MRFLLLSALLSVCEITWAQKNDNVTSEKLTAIHLLNYTSDTELMRLSQKIPQLADEGINCIFLEIDYSFEFKSHPELIQGDVFITKAGAKSFAKTCKKNGIKLIPEFQCFGHQSWAKNTFPLLTKYPELDLTPGAFSNNKDIYCREWDPTNPKVNKMIFPMIDEIVDAFKADGIHVGMDEIFLLGDSTSPNTFGKNPAELYAQVVNEFHAHFVIERGMEMYMWGDRLIDGEQHKYGEWEASMNGTHSAVDLIPKDVIICDWHYEPRPAYTSIDMFIEKGFKVLPCSYRKVEGVEALVMYSYRMENPQMLGHMFTTWGHIKKDELLDFPAMHAGLDMIKNKKFYDVAFEMITNGTSGEISVKMITPNPNLDVFYTLDGSIPSSNSRKYEKPFVVTQNITLTAMAFRGNKPAGMPSKQSFLVHKGSGKKIRYESAFSIKYPTEDGARTLINGKNGTKSFSDGQWLGFEGQNLEAVIMLGDGSKVSRVSLNSFNDPKSWIHHTEKVEVYVSDDDEVFNKVGEVKDFVSKDLLVNVEVAFDEVNAKYLKVVAHKRIIPSGYPGEGNPAWIFVDELVIE